MSKVGKKPITIPQGVEIRIEEKNLQIKGKGGTIVLPVMPLIELSLKDNELSVKAASDERQAQANWGTMRALAQNAVTGVSEGFTKELEIQGVGFRASMDGNALVLSVGFSHPVKLLSPEGVKVSVEKNVIKVSGSDKHLVGQTAAKIRAVKKPEPYQGKGIRYKGEVVFRKEGKKAAGATAA